MNNGACLDLNILQLALHLDHGILCLIGPEPAKLVKIEGNLKLIEVHDFGQRILSKTEAEKIELNQRKYPIIYLKKSQPLASAKPKPQIQNCQPPSLH